MQVAGQAYFKVEHAEEDSKWFLDVEYVAGQEDDDESKVRIAMHTQTGTYEMRAYLEDFERGIERFLAVVRALAENHRRSD